MKKNVLDYLWKTAELFPNKKAVVDSKKEITFADLKENARKISSIILRKGIHNSPIAVYLPKGCDMISAFAGINLSGNFYVPLDTKSPSSRVISILETLESKLIITDSAHKGKLLEFYSEDIVIVEDAYSLGAIEDKECDGTNYQIDTDPVYSIFTSGSTGNPKGVVVSHRGVIDYIDWAVDTFGISDSTVIGNQAPFYFDNSTLDIYLMYATGSTLVVVPEMLFSFPTDLVDFLNEKEISFVFWVPFVLINIANTDIFSQKLPKTLKDVFFAGEVMPNRHLNYWRKHLPNCRYANLYGPTEITVDCTYYVVNREFSDDEPLPIGIPCRNSDVMILVDRQRLAKQGEQGELCVRGSSLALGYYNNPEKTASAFIQNPLQSHYPETIYCTGDIVYENELNEIMYVGRVDAQIKHNGYRIELGEIENAVLASHLVDNCCVIYDHGEKKIVLYYESTDEIKVADFRKAISTKIPRYMLPSEYHWKSAMKTNNNGKIDRAYYNKLINK